MIKDKIISLETAKLAKEKGFDEEVIWMWYDIPFHKRLYPELYRPKLINVCERRYNWYIKNKTEFFISEVYHACELNGMRNWLRKKHKIFIEINLCRLEPSVSDKLGYTVKIHKSCFKFFKNIFSIEEYDEALEFAIQEGLKLIR